MEFTAQPVRRTGAHGDERPQIKLTPGTAPVVSANMCEDSSPRSGAFALTPDMMSPKCPLPRNRLARPGIPARGALESRPDLEVDACGKANCCEEMQACAGDPASCFDAETGGLDVDDVVEHE